MSIVTLADRIREAREPQVQGRMGGMMAVQTMESDPNAELPPEIASRIVPATGPVDPANPSARCDFCPRTQSADMLVEVEPDRYACDGCVAVRRWERGQ